MKIAMAQINPVIADIDGNRDRIITFMERARAMGADLVVFPEMATMGYPPMDLLESGKLVADNLASIEEIARRARGIAAVCGFVVPDGNNPQLLYNAAAFMRDGRVETSHRKTLLPTYDVFDETRYFSRGADQTIVTMGSRRLGITVCEDIWNDIDPGDGGHPADYYVKHHYRRPYDVDPVRVLAENHADIIINISASPFTRGKNRFKRMMLSEIARRHSLAVVYVNQVGGNDSLVFDGNSVIFGPDGAVRGRALPFEEDLALVDLAAGPAAPAPGGEMDDLEEIRRALVLGLRDYVHKCGFRSVVIGLSGGIDSALTAALAAAALGPEQVTGVTMPSVYSSAGSVDDSRKLAENLGIRFETIPIKGIFDRYRDDLRGVFRGRPEDVTEENLQARIRGNLLMAMSNKEGSLVLSTGNKSELAMGYCTLYGDMSGGLALISDLPKTLVYELARRMNAEREIIPAASIDKPPSAELRENQKDQDTLPPYDVLDRILELYVEERKSAAEIAACGFPEELVRGILRTVNLNEYKRRQAAPGIKVTAKAFGIGRRIPIAQRFKP